jgi:prepilin-type processing-associated H-X9-DG protein
MDRGAVAVDPGGATSEEGFCMQFHKMSELEDASGTIYVTEAFFLTPFIVNIGGGWQGDSGYSGITPMVRQGGAMATNFHGFASMNFLFADGHVAFLPRASTWGSGTQSAPKGMWTITRGD